jgi:predicted short-subunit dehydrogenase-like oxidoreductase (DUF2520 family)
VAQHLIKAFSESSEIDLVQAFARNKESLSPLLISKKITSDFFELKDADIYVIAVADAAIKWVSEQFTFENKLVIHTSGSVAMTEINSKNRTGVLYPVQSFSKNKAVNFKMIPIGIEAENESDLKTIEIVAKSISDAVFEIHSEQRKALHVAAVFVNNFVNHLYTIGNEICIENQIPFEILKPLIQETATKINTISPDAAQTGPAIRKDTNTINSHLAFLSQENQKTIYKILTQSIQKHGKKL